MEIYIYPGNDKKIVCLTGPSLNLYENFPHSIAFGLEATSGSLTPQDGGPSLGPYSNMVPIIQKYPIR